MLNKNLEYLIKEYCETPDRKTRQILLSLDEADQNQVLNSLTSKIPNYEFEILFINDGSKDNTLDLIKEQRNIDNSTCYNCFIRSIHRYEIYF